MTTKKNEQKLTTWDDYRREAAKKGDGGGPYKMPTPDGGVIEISRPTSGQVMDAQEASTPRASIRSICGDKADAVLDILEAESVEFMAVVQSDIARHFFGVDSVGEAQTSRT